VANAYSVRALRFMLFFIAASAGCRGENENAIKRETSHVRLLTTLHALATSKLGHTPRDMREFKQTIAKLSVTTEKLRVESIDELFVSERDGQPLVVVYGSTSPASDVVVYEQTGLNGKRQVGHRIGMVEEVDEAQFKDLTAPKH
jgi:hypothetical protein